MSTNVEARSPLASPALPPPHLRLASFEDYEQIRRLVVAHGFSFPEREDWRSLWLDNPLRHRLGGHQPIGWVLETPDGEIVGSLGTVSSRYRFRGSDLISAAGLRWFVATPYRGFALQLLDEYFNQPADLFINTTVGAAAVESFGHLCARVPAGDWQAVSCCVAEYRRFVQSGLQKRHLPFPWMLAYPAGGALWLKNIISNNRLPEPPRSVVVESTTGFDARFDTFWDELVRQNPEKLLAERTSRALSWHFGIPMRKGGLWILTASQNRQLRAYCILKGHYLTPGVRRMRLVDYQSIEQDVDLLPGLLHVALRRCAVDDVSVVEHLGVGVPKMRVFDQFASYRKRLPNWTFFYGAAETALQRRLRDPAVWDPSAFDGDASFE